MFSFGTVNLIFVVFVILYLPRIWCWFGSFKKQKRLYNSKKNKLALIIPARNEGKAVLSLFESIENQSYDRSNFDVFVVVKEYDDPVIEYAKAIGAEVFVDVNQTCKGDCLDSTIKILLKEKPGVYDGFLIVDADCVLDSKFMEEMNNAMESGADVINAKKLVKNYLPGNQQNCNWVTACNGLIWTFMDDMGNRWKSDHGFTTMTVTTGILFSKKLVEKWGGWIYRSTLTEDMELERDCALQGYKTFYYSHAKIYMEESPSLEMTNRRRTRWMTGVTHSDLLYGPKLLKKEKSFRTIANNYYVLCLWVVYGFVVSMIVIGSVNLIAGFIAMFSATYSLHYFAMTLYCFLGIYFIFFVLTAMAMFVSREQITLGFWDKIKLLFIHPLFYMKYISIVSKALINRKPQTWEVIERIEVQQ
ncbi:MAG: glycosyltransferase family 2 protein [Spirochaetaceae bacterium]|nr:glycosyltransferase family 2 protein [Spirochaetaceae bacterium]